MIKLRRSKVEKVSMLLELNQKRNQILKKGNSDFKTQSLFLIELLDLKHSLKFTDDFTREEFENTEQFIRLLEDENYEELARLQYKIDENS